MTGLGMGQVDKQPCRLLQFSPHRWRVSFAHSEFAPSPAGDDVAPAALFDSTGGYLVGPYPEARQCVGAERVAERDVGGVAATRDQHPANTWRVVARVEDMPL